MGFGGGGIANLFLLKKLLGRGKHGHEDLFTLLVLLDLLKDHDHDDDCDDEE